MKIKLFGAGIKDNYYSSQCPRIRQGLIELGNEIIEDGNCDTIFSNDPGGFQEAIEYKQKYGGILILNFLDIPFWINEFNKWLIKVKQQITSADIITTISYSSRYEISKYLGIDAKVIYNPIKDVSNLRIQKKIYPFISIGRVNDAGKRFYLVKGVVNRTLGRENNLIVCGSENPFYGQYKGIISDEELNLLLNQTKYMLYLASRDGLGLPPIEHVCCGGISILCNDSPTSCEFFPEYLLCDPNIDSITNKLLEIEQSTDFYRKICLDLANDYMVRFNKKTIAQNILNLVK